MLFGILFNLGQSCTEFSLVVGATRMLVLLEKHPEKATVLVHKRQYINSFVLLVNGATLTIYFYIFQEYAKHLKSPPAPPDDTWELVEQPKNHNNQYCICDRESSNKDKNQPPKDEL